MQVMTGNHSMRLLLRPMMIIFALTLAGCCERIDGYMAAASISVNGFARDGIESRTASGQEIRIWGFVDHHNLYGDEGARAILGTWWSGAGPDATSWRFNLKIRAGDAAGYSFPVYVPNDPGRSALLRVMLEDANARRPTKVFVKGRLFTFDAPTNLTTRVGLYMELQSSQDIQFTPHHMN